MLLSIESPWLAWAAAAAVLIPGATLLWAVSLRLRDASIVDPFWGPAFAVATWSWLLVRPTPDGLPLRAWIVAALVLVWATRLGVHLGVRALASAGEDPRYAAMRERGGRGWRWGSLFTVFWLQAGLVLVIGTPLFAATRSAETLGVLDGIAAVVVVLGILVEAVADRQLAAHRRDPATRGRVLDTGLWRWSRHPNYFGDALLWWGFGLFAVAAGAWWTLFAPVLMTLLLLKISGVPLLEARLEETRPGYGDYVRRTPAFFPWFPKEQDS